MLHHATTKTQAAGLLLQRHLLQRHKQLADAQYA
jgi:hypothetical protein